MPTTPYYSLSLADGTRWLIRAGDPDAARVVAALGAAMQLRPAPPYSYGTSPPARGGGARGGRELLVTVGRGKTPLANLSGPGPAVCVLSPLFNDDLLNINVSRLALVIVREAQSRGGVLLHGALAQAPPLRGGAGVLLAGPGTVGKTTASSRLPPPWRSLSDDAALVVRDAQGQYWAHPWPTWSRFYSDGPGGSWDVQHAVPLQAIFFLSQSPEDRAEPLHVTQVTAMLMEAVQHVSRPMTRRLPENEVQALYQEQLAAVEALARAIPAYTLHISLSGAFWKEIERVLRNQDSRMPNQPTDHVLRIPYSVTQVHDTQHATRSTQPAPIESLLGDGVLHVVCTGPSMNPTLREPDLLEVIPYEGQPMQPGDVVYFQPPEGGREVVHRVVAVTPRGIRTRGDNNPQEDPYLLQPDDVIGRVVVAQRGIKRRRIAGGRQGVLVGYGARLWRVVNRGVSRLLHGAYRALAGRFRRLLPAGLRPRVFAFQARQQIFLKLLMGRRVVGQYDTREEQWRIRRPFRLFVDEAGLPVLPTRRYSRTAHAVSGAAPCGCGRPDTGRGECRAEENHAEGYATGPGERSVV